MFEKNIQENYNFLNKNKNVQELTEKFNQKQIVIILFNEQAKYIQIDYEMIIINKFEERSN